MFDRGRRRRRPMCFVLSSEDRLQRRQTGELRLDYGPELRVDDQRSHSAVWIMKASSGPVRRKLEWYEDLAPIRALEHHKEEHRLVESEKCDPVAFLDASAAASLLAQSSISNCMSA